MELEEMIHEWQDGYSTVTIDTGYWPPILQVEGRPYRDINNYTVRDTVEINLTEELAHDLSVTLDAVSRKFKDYDAVTV